MTPNTPPRGWWLFPNCTCPIAWRSYGRVYGLDIGEGWVRASTDPDCPDHTLAPRPERPSLELLQTSDLAVSGLGHIPGEQP